MTTDFFRFVGYPVRVYAGLDAISSLAGEADRLKAQRVLVVCGQSVADKTDLVDRVKQALGDRLCFRITEPEKGSVSLFCARTTMKNIRKIIKIFFNTIHRIECDSSIWTDIHEID